MNIFLFLGLFLHKILVLETCSIIFDEFILATSKSINQSKEKGYQLRLRRRQRHWHAHIVDKWTAHIEAVNGRGKSMTERAGPCCELRATRHVVNPADLWYVYLSYQSKLQLFCASYFMLRLPLSWAPRNVAANYPFAAHLSGNYQNRLIYGTDASVNWFCGSLCCLNPFRYIQYNIRLGSDWIRLSSVWIFIFACIWLAPANGFVMNVVISFRAKLKPLTSAESMCRWGVLDRSKVAMIWVGRCARRPTIAN